MAQKPRSVSAEPIVEAKSTAASSKLVQLTSSDCRLSKSRLLIDMLNRLVCLSLGVRQIVRVGVQHDSLDRAMSEYLLELYEDGAHVWEGTYTLYGYQFLFNRGVDSTFMPAAKKALKAWKRRQPSAMRLPVPEEVIFALGNVMLGNGHVLAAAALALQYHTYMRPSEVVTLCHNQICAPVKNTAQRYHHWGIVLAPQSMKKTTKTGEMDDSVLLDVSYHPVAC